jgi:hypothetical protein
LSGKLISGALLALQPAVPVVQVLELAVV